MSQNESPVVANAVQPQPATAQPAPSVAPIIAMRKSCNPDGVGLSHYVLMDRKVAK